MNTKPAVLVTGANGFVGHTLCQRLIEQGYLVRQAVRQRDGAGSDNIAVVGDLASLPDLTVALSGIDVVIHLAARVHVMHDTSTDPLAEFRRINVEATKHLARQAVKSGVRRLVFISSIKVNGDGKPSAYTENDPVQPSGDYGVSKWEAEQALLEISKATALEVVIVRPPLVYGEGVGGNLDRLIRLVSSGIPMPLGSINNRRSMIGVDNLADFLICCAVHPAAANQLFIASDDEVVSTAELMRIFAREMHKRSQLFPFPASLLSLAARLAHQQAVYERLFGSLTVDPRKAHELLGWTPPFRLEQGIQRTIQSYMRSKAAL